MHCRDDDLVAVEKLDGHVIIAWGIEVEIHTSRLLDKNELMILDTVEPKV